MYLPLSCKKNYSAIEKKEIEFLFFLSIFHSTLAYPVLTWRGPHGSKATIVLISSAIKEGKKNRPFLGHSISYTSATVSPSPIITTSEFHILLILFVVARNPPFRFDRQSGTNLFHPDQKAAFVSLVLEELCVSLDGLRGLDIEDQVHWFHLIHFSCTKMGGTFGRSNTLRRNVTESKLDAKMVEVMQRRALQGTSMKSFNNIILKFPRIDESLRNCKTIFEQFDEDSNGAIDPGELKRCFQKLEISLKEEEIDDLFTACDINENMGMKFNEFIVLLCLAYLLKEPAAEEAKSRLGLEDLEITFETLVDAFVFLDKNKDGYVSKNEMIDAINETTGGERSSGRIAMRRFEEMDWDRNGMVTFKEFLFAFTGWVGIDDTEEDEEDGS